MAQRDQGMRMLISDDEDEEDDGDEDEEEDGDEDDEDEDEDEDDDHDHDHYYDDDDHDDDDDDDNDEDEDDEDDEDEDENEDENEDDDPLPAGNLLSGGSGGTRGGSNLGLPGGGLTWKFLSGFSMVLLPAYSLLKQEQLQLAQASFRDTMDIMKIMDVIVIIIIIIINKIYQNHHQYQFHPGNQRKLSQTYARIFIGWLGISRCTLALQRSHMF